MSAVEDDRPPRRRRFAWHVALPGLAGVAVSQIPQAFGLRLSDVAQDALIMTGAAFSLAMLVLGIRWMLRQ